MSTGSYVLIALGSLGVGLALAALMSADFLRAGLIGVVAMLILGAALRPPGRHQPSTPRWSLDIENLPWMRKSPSDRAR